MSAQQWLISHDCAEPPAPEVLDELRSRSAETVDRLLRLSSALGVPNTGAGDREDFIEHTMRIDAALAAVGHDRLWIEDQGGTMSRVGTDETAPLDLSLPRIGAMFSPSFCRLGSDHGEYASVSGAPFVIPSSVGPDGYFESEVFAAENRRGAVLAGGDTESLAAAIRSALLRSSDRTVWLKSRFTKAIIMRVRVPQGWENDPDPDLSLSDVRDPWVSPWDLIMAHEGKSRAILVAPHVEMRAEYRLFLVDGHPVTGAGNIESHTPLDHARGSIFDPKVEGVRGDGEIGRRPDLVDAYVRRGTSLGERLRDEGRGTCALDLALIDGRIGIVELNALGNAGLYASDPYRLYLEVAARPDLFTPTHL